MLVYFFVQEILFMLRGNDIVDVAIQVGKVFDHLAILMLQL